MNCSKIKRIRLHPECDRRHAAHMNQNKTENVNNSKLRADLEASLITFPSSKHSAAIFTPTLRILGYLQGLTTHDNVRWLSLFP